MSIIYRSEKGDELTYDEVDNNFAELKSLADSKEPAFDVLPFSKGGTGQTTLDGVRTALDIPDTASQIEFTQTGTGAVGISVNNKLLDVSISVSDFGAVGDGSNESSKFQLAVNALPSQGGKIIIPSGNYSNTNGSEISVGNKTVKWICESNCIPPTNLPGLLHKEYYGQTYIVSGESFRNGKTFNHMSGVFPVPDNEKYRCFDVQATMPNTPATDVNRDLIAYSYRLITDHHGPLGGEIRGIKGIVIGDGGQSNLRSAHIITQGTNGHTGDITGVLADVFHSDLSPGSAGVGKSAAFLGQVGAGISDGFSLRSRPSPSDPLVTWQNVKYGYRVQEGDNAVCPTIACFQGHGGGGGSLLRGLKSDTDSTVLTDIDALGKVLGQAFRSGHVTIADDAVATITPACATGFMAVFAEGTSANWAIRYFRTGASPVMSSVASGGSGASTTGTLTGTTGTDGFLTISAKTDGTIDIENRSGASRTVNYLFIGRN